MLPVEWLVECGGSSVGRAAAFQAASREFESRPPLQHLAHVACREPDIRIWDVPCAALSDKHLLGEHVELHTMWNAHERGLTGGYSRHPETLRWTGHLEALRLRHEEQAAEMARRGFRHQSPLRPMDTSNQFAGRPSARLPGSIPPEASPDAVIPQLGPWKWGDPPPPEWGPEWDRISREDAESL